MNKYYSVMVYWKEAGPESVEWIGEKEEWTVSACSVEEAEQRAIEINDFTVRDYEADGWDYEVDGCVVSELEGKGHVDEWKKYQGWLAKKFKCVDCGCIDYFPKEDEIGKFCSSCWDIQQNMKILASPF